MEKVERKHNIWCGKVFTADPKEEDTRQDDGRHIRVEKREETTQKLPRLRTP